MKKSKRGEYTRKRKKKFKHLKNTGMLSEYYKQKRESTKKEIKEFEKDIPKVETEIKEQKIMETKYNFIQGIIKAVKYVILFALGTLSVGIPMEWGQLTVAGLIVLVYNFLKIQWLPRLP